MNMFKLALEAQLPLVSFTTTDTVNAEQVLAHLLDPDVVSMYPGINYQTKQPGFYLLHAAKDSFEDYYRDAVKRGATLIFMNCPSATENALVFDGGVLPTPTAMVEDLLGKVMIGEEIPAALATLGGLTLKEVSEICRLTMTEFGELSPRHITQIRGLYASKVTGLEQVNAELAFHYPKTAIEKWVEQQGPFFTTLIDPMFVPRGLLFYGAPGTGKTESAKRISSELGVPLYRLDIPSMMTKWQGDSESNLKNALQLVEQEAPCVVLLDEVEKLFNGDGDSGSSTRMLSQLLWWLQEHRSQVLTLMTTNAIGTLPAELYRAGRIDEKIMFNGLGYEQSLVFCFELVHHLSQRHALHSFSYIPHFKDAGHNQYPQAELTQMVYTQVKKYLLTNDKL